VLYPPTFTITVAKMTCFVKSVMAYFKCDGMF